ncbi:MAG TPA: hypothetical protein VM737_07120 [Gemmatimonadota bacterium]|nr:hypothetical protein [Gemmatimonadota bacterium]
MVIPRGVLAIAVVVLAAYAAPSAQAQQAEPEPAAPSLRPGPTREARAVTARSLAPTPSPPAAQVLPRYFTFQRDFAADFGFPVASPAASDTAAFVHDLRGWVVSRWGETSFYEWVERALVVYAHVQASTRFERRGFNMGVEMDDVAEGKLGVRVSRALE